jgi:hypothetical protein
MTQRVTPQRLAGRGRRFTGTGFGLSALGVSGTLSGVASLGLVMATVMWVSAAHVLFNADRIADRACAEDW